MAGSQFGMMRHTERATYALNAMSAAAHGAMLGMSLARGQIMGAAFSVIFLRFSVVKLVLLFGGLAAAIVVITRLMRGITRMFIYFGKETPRVMRAVNRLQREWAIGLREVRRALGPLYEEGIVPLIRDLARLTRIMLRTITGFLKWEPIVALMTVTAQHLKVILAVLAVTTLYLGTTMLFAAKTMISYMIAQLATTSEAAAASVRMFREMIAVTRRAIITGLRFGWILRTETILLTKREAAQFKGVVTDKIAELQTKRLAKAHLYQSVTIKRGLIPALTAKMVRLKAAIASLFTYTTATKTATGATGAFSIAVKGLTVALTWLYRKLLPWIALGLAIAYPIYIIGVYLYTWIELLRGVITPIEMVTLMWERLIRPLKIIGDLLGFSPGLGDILQKLSRVLRRFILPAFRALRSLILYVKDAFRFLLSPLSYVFSYFRALRFELPEIDLDDLISAFLRLGYSVLRFPITMLETITLGIKSFIATVALPALKDFWDWFEDVEDKEVEWKFKFDFPFWTAVGVSVLSWLGAVGQLRTFWMYFWKDVEAEEKDVIWRFRFDFPFWQLLGFTVLGWLGVTRSLHEFWNIFQKFRPFTSVEWRFRFDVPVWDLVKATVSGWLGVAGRLKDFWDFLESARSRWITWSFRFDFPIWEQIKAWFSFFTLWALKRFWDWFKELPSEKTVKWKLEIEVPGLDWLRRFFGVTTGGIERLERVSAEYIARAEATVRATHRALASVRALPGMTEELIARYFRPPIAVEVPRLRAQRGAIITRPTTVRVGEAGPEAIIPLRRRGFAPSVVVNITGNYILDEPTARTLADAVSSTIMRKLHTHYPYSIGR